MGPFKLAFLASVVISFASVTARPAAAEKPDLGSDLGAQHPTAGTPEPIATSGIVMLIDEAEIPAQEAGSLAEIKVREGAEVRSGDLLARIDDRRVAIDKRVAEFEYQAAQNKSQSDINVRYAKAAADVAEAEYLAANDANHHVANSVALAEVRKMKLEHGKSVLQIEQSGVEQSVAHADASAAAAKVEAADDTIRRRRIVSPIDGTVVEIRRHVGEWVQPGEVLLHVVRLDRLRIEGFVKSADVRPSRVRGHQVTVIAELPGGEKRELRGKVVFVNPLLQAAGDYKVWAEVDNRSEDGQWILQPGQPVAMRID
ncbi:MAG: HlyD family efflux transporter periplasmic adaptor subunit [Planctomycetia bacterium]|nr:HlyD family efflux transporter periplasmic adaptor subunit [Planctomycetia bacterium]